MKRIVVVGGRGLFGRSVIAQLQHLGHRALPAARTPTADVIVDADDPSSLADALAADDLVIDTAGPFQKRTTALIDAAIEIGFDLIDINDDLSYAEQILERRPQIDDAGIRVLSSASTVSAVSAAVIRQSGFAEPVCVRAFLVPASRQTANRGSARSLIESVGRPIRILREGRLQTVVGWSEPRRPRLPKPLRSIHARLFESADAVHLPQIWPTLQDVSMYVDTNTPGINALLTLAKRVPAIRRLLAATVGLGTRMSRLIGSDVGGLAYELDDADGNRRRVMMTSSQNSYLTAVAPAVLAARSIVEGRFEPRGLVPPDQHVAADELFDYLANAGIRLVELE